jgi:hypothetical protein
MTRSKSDEVGIAQGRVREAIRENLSRCGIRGTRKVIRRPGAEINRELNISPPCQSIDRLSRKQESETHARVGRESCQDHSIDSLRSSSCQGLKLDRSV